MKAIYWNEATKGMTFEYAEIPADMLDECQEMHEYIVECAAEATEEFMDKYLEEEALTEERD